MKLSPSRRSLRIVNRGQEARFESKNPVSQGPGILGALSSPEPRDGSCEVSLCVNHLVPTFAYLVDDGRSAVIFGDDSGPTMFAAKLLQCHAAPESSESILRSAIESK
jgi:hypothetical protein